MPAILDFSTAQSFMRQHGIDAWLLYDFRGSNSVFGRLLARDDNRRRWTTRRCWLLVPANGEPVLLVHGIDKGQFEDLHGKLKQANYLSWQDLSAWLQNSLKGMKNVAMEYAPGGNLPVMGIVDAGTVELVRSTGVTVVSSADCVQTCIAVWSPEAVKLHDQASSEVNAIKDGAFDLIRQRLKAGKSVTEFEVQTFILNEFKRVGLETTEPPIVGANAHAGDPHFEVSSTDSSVIKHGDWILIDLWARRPGENNIFSDITWVGYCGSDVPKRHYEVAHAVMSARDASLKLVTERFAQHKQVMGWELDDAAHNVLKGAGLGEYVRHRTGHSLSPGPMVHGVGANLDNLETRDTRIILPGTGFTIEPGAYLPTFGVRSEINVYVDPTNGPRVTSNTQREVLFLA